MRGAGVAKRKRMQPKTGRKKRAKRRSMPGVPVLGKLNREVAGTTALRMRVFLADQPNADACEQSVWIWCAGVSRQRA